MKFTFTTRKTGIFTGKNYTASMDSRVRSFIGMSSIEVSLKKFQRLFKLLFNAIFIFPALTLQLQPVNGRTRTLAAGSERAHSRSFMNSVLLAFIILVSNAAMAQKAPSTITTVNMVPAKKSTTVNGYGLNPEYPVVNSYNLRFGSQNATTDGVNNVITSFVVDGLTYKPIPRPAVTPYDTVILKRKVNPKVADLGKFTAFYQNNGNVLAPTTKPVPSSTTLFYPPEFVGSMESLINSYTVNRGTDNLFANVNGATLNTIERVDLVLSNGVTAGDVVKTGFLLMERGGNDPYKIAAITSLTASGEVATLGPLVNGPMNSWGSTGISITSTVFQRNTGDAEMRPNQNIEAQPIKGSYVSFQGLGIPSKTTIYGIALFPDDVTSSTDLVNLSNVPLNTGAGSGIGGLDFMAGGGFFVEEHQALAFSLSGNIFDDGNGLKNAMIDGNGIGNPGGSQLFAYLVGSDNVVKAKDTVTLSGTYVFDNQLMGDTEYTVVISTVNVAVADAAPSAALLPADWVITGDSYGNSNLSGSGIQAGIPDMRVNVKTRDASMTNVNFGIEQLPVAGNGTVTLPNPGGTNSALVPSNTFSNVIAGSDADGFITSILVSFPVANANTITIGGTTYSALQFAAAFPLGDLINTDAVGNPAQPIMVDPISDDNTTVVIPFIAIDNAGVKSANTGSATIIFLHVNQVPVAVNDVNATNEDTPVSGSVTGNDTQSGDGGNVWTLVGTDGGATHGTVTMNADGSYTYTPAVNYNGTDVFNYKLCDVDTDCATATVTITIVPVNDVPLAQNDVNTTNEDTPVNGSVTGNDTQSGDGGNVWTLVGTDGGAMHGTVTMNADGSYTYTPAANYNGTDVFTYTLCDVDSDCATATVTITIVPVNDVPLAQNDVNTTNEDTPVNGSVTGNDTPSGDGGNVWTLVGTNGGATHGTVTMNADGSYTYTPAANYNGTDVFNYKVCDVDNDCASAKVTITIVPVNDVPLAQNDVNTTNEDTPVNGSVTGNDTPSGDGGNVWTLVATNGGATHGTVTMNVDGSYTYTPAANYNGTDVFNYKVCDVDNDCASAKVTITIVPVNDVPLAQNDVNTTNEDTPVNGTVTGNDTPSGDGGNVWTLVGANGGATHGTVTMNVNGTYTYTPAANYNGTDVFNYKVCDVDNDCASAKVTITIVPVNDVPLAQNDVNTTNEDTPVNGTGTGNDTPSGDGGNVWTLVGANGGATHGTVTMNVNGTYTYTPAANYNGTDVFNYKVCDVDNDCASAKVTITIVPVNDVPLAQNDVNTTNEDTPVNGSVTGNDTPSGDGGNVWTLVGTNGGATHGTVTMNVNGTYTYTPAANYNGTDVFNYKLCDVDNDCASATVTITIVPVNDVPLAVNDVNSTNQNTPVSGSVTGNDTPSGDGGNVWTLVGTNGGATHGTVTLTAAGTYTYTPATNYFGTDVFNYKLCDLNTDCSSATVTITIAPVVTFCGCTPAATDILTNGSFESGTTGWSSTGGNLTYGTGYAVCGTKNAFLQRTTGTAKMWQDVTGIAVGSTVTLKAWAGTHTAGISCNPKLILGFYNSAGALISSTFVTVDKDVDKPDYKLKEFTVIAVVPAGTVKVRVEGDIDCNWLKLDAVCLTVSATAPATGSIGNLVWNDVNDNGKQDSGEPGIAGASVKLTYPNATTAIKTTDANGGYNFTNLTAGTYKVTFTTPSGFVASAANQGTSDDLDSDPVAGDVSVVLAATQSNNSIDAAFHVVVCTNTTQNKETYPNQYNTGFTTSLLNKTFAGSSGTWTANSNSKATIVVVAPYYSASSTYALKIVNYSTKTSGAGSCSAASPLVNLIGACCPEKLKMAFTLWTYACTSGDNAASLKLDFSNNGGSSWTEVGSATSAQLFSSYGANGKTTITVAVPLSYQNANFKYRFRGEMAAGDPNNFYLFIDDISITSPANCTSVARGVSINTLPTTAVSNTDLAVKVLSNPSVTSFQLNIQSNVADVITVRVTDMFGRTLKVINHVQANTTLNVGDDLQRGNYFVEVKQNTITKVLKLVKL